MSKLKILHQSHPLRVFLHSAAIAVSLILILFSLTSCGGGGDGDDGQSSGIGWITISSSNINYVNNSAICSLSGEAFVSDAYVAHKCAGLACLFGWYDNSYPGVEVTWWNLTTGLQGTAVSRYGTLTAWDHLYTASVPLVVGINQIEVTASDPAGNSASAKTSVNYIPPAPGDLRANTDDSQVELFWSPISNATGYRIYWATTPGAAFTEGMYVELPSSPFIHAGLANGTTYYYAITSLYLSEESPASLEVQATVGAPPKPVNVDVNYLAPDNQVMWDDILIADSYNLYWDNVPGASNLTGTQIIGVSSPFLHTDVSGQPYYYSITGVNIYGESLGSTEVMVFPPIPPPAPVGFTVSQRRDWSGSLPAVDLVWQPVSGVLGYDIFRCWAWANSTVEGCQPSTGPFACYGPWEKIGSNVADTNYVDWSVDTVAYWYYIVARNPYGLSPQSEWAGLCVDP